jgi:hypothetical protein
MACPHSASVPFIGFISERELREREERERAQAGAFISERELREREEREQGRASCRSMSLVAGSPAVGAQQSPLQKQQQISWAEAWEKSAAAAEPLPPPATVLAGASARERAHGGAASASMPAARSTAPAADRGSHGAAAGPGEGPSSPSKCVPKSPGSLSRDSLSSPGKTANRRLKAAQTLPHLPLLPGPAAAAVGDWHSLSASNAAGGGHQPADPPLVSDLSTVVKSEYPQQAPILKGPINSVRIW